MLEVLAFVAVCYFFPVPCLIVAGVIGGILALSWTCERIAAGWRWLMRAGGA